MNHKVAIARLPTGVPGLDAILGGGLPEFSFNLIGGPPGSGKTTLAHQLMFAMATPERPALYFTILGEPVLKMLRYQQQFTFFDPDRVNDTIRFVSLSEDLAVGDLERVLAHIMKEVEAMAPGLVFVDSFSTAFLEGCNRNQGQVNPQWFIQQLGILMSTWQATTFLIGDTLVKPDLQSVLTVADGLLMLSQNVYRNSMVRKLQVLKMRGQAPSPGIHTFRITGAGLETYPSVGNPTEETSEARRTLGRLPMGVKGLDDMLGGGLPSGYSLLVAGPSGSGKTILATAFLAEGVRRGEPGVMVAFEQVPSESWSPALDTLIRSGKVGLINARSLDLSIDEVVQRMVETIRCLGATRVVIDSLSGFELAVAPTFREDFRESLFRVFGVLSNLGVTVLVTSELEDRYTDLRFSSYGSAFLTDAIIVQRYIEVESSLRRVMAVVKLRGSAHCNDLREYEITDEGIRLGRPMLGFEGLLGGRPTGRPAVPAALAGGIR